MRYSQIVPELSEWIEKLDLTRGSISTIGLQDLLIKARKHIIDLEKNKVPESEETQKMKDQLKEQVKAEIQKHLDKLKVT